MKPQDYKLDILVQGYPGKSVCHGGLGWSTIVAITSWVGDDLDTMTRFELTLGRQTAAPMFPGIQ
jgi:hypothetical protein